MSKAVIFFCPPALRSARVCSAWTSCAAPVSRSRLPPSAGEKIVKSARQISVVADALAEELDYTVLTPASCPAASPVCPT